MDIDHIDDIRPDIDKMPKAAERGLLVLREIDCLIELTIQKSDKTQNI
jgi:hypothetical protein